VHDFQDDWVVYDTRQKANVPFVVEQHQNVTSHTLNIDIEANRNYTLLIFSRDNNFLFVDGALKQRLPANEWLKMNIDSLFSITKKNEIAITIFGSDNIEDKKVLIGYDKKAAVKTNNSIIENLLIAKPRLFNSSNNIIIIIGVFLVILFTILFNSYSKQLNTFYSPGNLFTFLVREQSFGLNTPFSPQTFLFIIFLSFLMAVLGTVLHEKNRFFSFGGAFLQQGDTLIVFLFNYLKISFLALLSLIVRYMLITLVGTVFKVDKIADVHFSKGIQASLIFYTFLTPFVAMFILNFPHIELNWALIVNICIGFYVLRAFIAFRTIERSLPVKNLYLFSYLCIVEILPILLGIRYLS
jgi:hypothetical protein